MKKVVLRQMLSSLFVMLAFSIMLIHEVIPHHHHADHICLQHIGDYPDQGNEAESSHSHHDPCALQDMPVLTAGSHLHEYTTQPVPVNHHPDVDFCTCLHAHSPNILLLTPLPFRQTPFEDTPASVYTGSTPSLRAPPVG